jgi:uncharacterized protein YcgI (DUF1989 family)
MKKQDKQLEKILFEVYDKGVKQQDCNLTECIENVKQALRIHDVSGQLPCHHNYIQKDTYWKSCTHCGMIAPLGQ